MARKTLVTLVDDIDGSDAAETVTFGIDGTSYEIDLSEKHAADLREVLGRYTAAAGATGSERRAARTTTAIPSTGDSRTAEIRAWAHTNGHDVPARGRIPQRVVAAFDAAQ